MEKEYSILKLAQHIKSWKRRKMLITHESFSYHEMNSMKNIRTFHITQLLNIIIDKTDDTISLILKLRNNQTLIITIKENNKQLEELKDMLLIIKRNYGIFMMKTLYMINFMEKFNPKELKNNIDLYITDSMYKEIDTLLIKHSEEIDQKTKAIWEIMQELILDFKEENEKIDDNDKKQFMRISTHLEDEYDDEIQENEKPKITFSHFERFALYYRKLLEILSTLRRNQIEYRFKRVNVFNEARLAYHIKEDFNLLDYDKKAEKSKEKQIDIENNNNQIESTSITKPIDNNNKTITVIKEIDNHQSKEEQLELLKKENAELRNKFFKSLHIHSKKKEKLKRCIITSHAKIYSCYNCGNILSHTDKEPSCHYDINCTNNCIFCCKKCKITFCTYCILYQRNSKCAKNHRLFPSKTLNVCLLCSNSDSKTYFACLHCGIAICSICMGERQTKEINCWNCNMELIWRKEVYAQCNKCSNVKECFWGCSNCDYSICLKCVQTNQGFCGAAHKLIAFNSNTDWQMLEIENKAQFSQDFNLKFMGKCMKCDNNIEGKVFACLRCAYFICEGCN